MELSVCLCNLFKSKTSAAGNLTFAMPPPLPVAGFASTKFPYFSEWWDCCRGARKFISCGHKSSSHVSLLKPTEQSTHALDWTASQRHMAFECYNLLDVQECGPSCLGW